VGIGYATYSSCGRQAAKIDRRFFIEPLRRPAARINPRGLTHIQSYWAGFRCFSLLAFADCAKRLATGSPGAFGMLDLFKALVLGVVEGLTEFLPVSSTGHLLLVEHFFGFNDDTFGKSFAILIQLGAILALLSIYFHRLWSLFLGMFKNPDDQRFVIGVLLAFLPAAVIGALAHSYIKSMLFDVRIVCVMFVIGGFILLWIDRMNLQPRFSDATKFTLPMYFGIGVIQCIAMIPGVSRSGATIVGAMLFGADRRSAAEFSFWLAMPTMVGAFVLEAYKSRADFTSGNLLVVAVGFAASFVCGWIVVKTFLGYVQHHSFAVFAWWRIIVGALGLAALAVGL
jgi:undecaprenyl-diphosphatase